MLLHFLRITFVTALLLAFFHAPRPGYAVKLPFAAAQRLEVRPFAAEVSHADGHVIQLHVDADQLQTLKSNEVVRLEGLPLGVNLTVNLDLKRIDVFAPHARIVRGTANGDVPMARPDVALFSGRVVGRMNSTAFLGISSGQANGWIAIDGETFILTSGQPHAGGELVAYAPARLPEGMLKMAPFTCDSEAIEILLPALQAGGQVDGSTPRGAGQWLSACRRANIAIETDFEYTDWLFDGDVDEAAAYTAILIGAVTEIFMRDFNVSLQISFLRLWDTEDDPWNQSSTSSQLFQFRDYWNANMTHVDRNAVHFLSARPLGGGVAYRPGLCYPEYDYGLSANLNGFFPYPIQNNSTQNWDLMVVAHELGHNFNAPHTHSMNPPVDQCAQGDCSVTPNGTIMSYCHLCPGGLANVRMEMGDRIVNETILPLLNAQWFCDLTIPCDPEGDCNGDGVLDFADIDCFVEVALGQNLYNGPMQRSDLYNDGQVNGLDAQPFVEALLAP